MYRNYSVVLLKKCHLGQPWMLVFLSHFQFLLCTWVGFTRFLLWLSADCLLHFYSSLRTINQVICFYKGKIFYTCNSKAQGVNTMWQLNSSVTSSCFGGMEDGKSDGVYDSSFVVSDSYWGKAIFKKRIPMKKPTKDCCLKFWKWSLVCSRIHKALEMPYP